MQFVESNCQTDLTMSAVAEHCGMSYTAFSRFFARYAQKSFPEYLTGVRLRRAALLLTTTHNSITQIAMDCGFSTASYFIQRFRQHNGVAPGEFRRQIEAGAAQPRI